MLGQSLSGADLEKALNDNTLDAPGTTVTGMVKASEKAGHVQFSQSGCEGWVEIPVTLIEKADHVGTQPCRDHSHRVMQLTFKEAKDPLSKMLAALLSHSSQMPSRPAPAEHGGIGQPFIGGRADPPIDYPPHPYDDPSARMAGDIGGVGTGGGLNAWGCWSSWCCDHYVRECFKRPFSWHPVCTTRCVRPYRCERCIWPY